MDYKIMYLSTEMKVGKRPNLFGVFEFLVKILILTTLHLNKIKGDTFQFISCVDIFGPKISFFDNFWPGIMKLGKSQNFSKVPIFAQNCDFWFFCTCKW